LIVSIVFHQSFAHSTEKNRFHSYVVVVVVVGATRFKKSPRLRRFRSDRDEIWQECTSSKCASINGVL